MSKNISVVFPDDLSQQMSERAEKEGVSVSDFIRQAVRSYLLIDPVLIRNAARFGAGLQMPAIEIISRFAVGRLARLQAQLEVWGPSHRLIHELMQMNNESDSAQLLFDTLKEVYVKEEELMKREQADG